MKQQPNVLSAAILAALGLTAASTPATAAVDPGAYDLVVLPTPTKATSSSLFIYGTDGAWNSSFSFNQVPQTGSQGMTDNGVNLEDADGGGTASRAFGSSVAADGYAGKLGITVSGTGAVSVSSFSKDTIFGTAGGDFAQEGGDLTKYLGSVNLGSGAMTLATGDFTTGIGRRGAIDSTGGQAPGQNPCGGPGGGAFCDNSWNKDDFGVVTGYATFSTGSASGDVSTINGAVLTSIGDVNDDSTTDYKAVLVSGGDVGTSWLAFAGNDYYEVWSVQLLYKSGVARNDADTTTFNTARAIPVLANDFGSTTNAPLAVTVAGAATNGTTAITGGGTTVTYTPNLGFIGTDSFSYTMADGFGKTATASVQITVSSSAVAASDDGANIAQGNSVLINVAANDSSGTDLNSIVPTSPTQGGTAVATNDGTGNVRYTPLIDFVGTDTFTYTIRDTGGTTSNPATVTVNVAAGPLTDQGTYSGTILTAADIGVADPGVGQSCVGKCFDFTISGAANLTTIVLPPLDAPVQSSNTSKTTAVSRYRILKGGVWQDFNTSAGDSVASAPKSPRGGCPGPNDPSWKPWNGATATDANNTDECVRLIMADGGLNDTDSNPGSIKDPSGVGTTTTSKSTTGTVNSFLENAGGGCTLRSDRAGPAGRADWWILGAFIGMLGWLRRRRVQG